MIRKFKGKINSLELSFKREILLLALPEILFLVLAITLSLIFKNLIFILIFVLLLIAYIIFYLYRLNNIGQKKKTDLIVDFVYVFSFFKIYILNGHNVYSSLKEIIQYANDKLSEKLTMLISDIDNDKTITPFINFSKSFNDLTIEQISVAIFEMIDDGCGYESLSHFEVIFDKFSDIIHKEQIDKKERTLSSFSITALIGAAILIIFVTFGVLQIIGGMVNGL